MMSQRHLKVIRITSITNPFLSCLGSTVRFYSGVNLQVCFVNDSSSDKDSDAEDSRTETSLDTPLSPVVCTAGASPDCTLKLEMRFSTRAVSNKIAFT